MTSITTGGVTFTFQDGNVHTVESSLNSGIENNPTKGGPMRGRNWDNNGCTKTITLKGALTAAVSTRTSTGTVTTIYSQKQWLESLVNGSQSAITIDTTYEDQSVLDKTPATSPFQGAFTSTKILVQTMRFTERAGEPNRLDFEIVFVVGES